MPAMSDGDSVSSIPDDMLFGSGSFETSNTKYGNLTNYNCQKDEISRSDLYCSTVVQENMYTDIHKELQLPVFSTHNHSGSYYVRMHDKNEVPIIPVSRIKPMSRIKSDSEIYSRSCHNNRSSSLQNEYLIRKNEAIDVDTMYIKGRKCDLESEVTKAQERQFIIKGDYLTDPTLKCSLRTKRSPNSDKSVQQNLSKQYKETNKLTYDSTEEPCQTLEEIADCKAGQTRETIQSSLGKSLNTGYRFLATQERTNEGELLSGHSYYTCYIDLPNGDQFMTDNGFETCMDDSCSLVEETHKENVGPGVMKVSNDASHIAPVLKDKSFYAHVDCHFDQNFLKSQDREDNHVKAESNEVTNSAKTRDMLLDSTLNTDSFDEDDLEEDIGNLVAYVGDLSADYNACAKAMTEEDTTCENASTAFDKGRTNKEFQRLDLSRDDQNPQEMRSIFLSNKSNERLEVASLEIMVNTTSGLYSDQSAGLDILSDNTVSSSYDHAETRVKELSDDFELSAVNEDYVQQMNRTENQLNKTSSDPQHPHVSTDPQHPHVSTDPQHPHVSTDPKSLADLRALHQHIPGVSLIYRLRDDIENIQMEESHSHHHLRNENGISMYGSESRRTVPGRPLQLQEINDNYSQIENGYTLENYILSSPAHSGVYFQQGANRILVRDTERSMVGPFESNAEVPGNGRSEESIIYGLANEFRDVKVAAYDTHHRETDLQVNHNEPSHSDYDLFGGPNESSVTQTRALQGTSSTAHQDSFENSPAIFHNEKTKEIIPSSEVTLPVHTANSLLSHQSINETPDILDADSSYQANDISGEITVPVQEAISRSLSYESLHRDRERPLICRQISCPSTESRSDSFSFDEEQQRDFEYALELQQQLNHEILMEDEALARLLDSSQRETLNPPGYGSRRTEFFGPQAEEMINLNPQRRQQRQQHSNRHPGRHRMESAANRDGQSNREQSPEDETNRGHTLHTQGNSQGNMLDVMQQRGAVAGVNVADSRMPFESGFQSVRQSSARVSNRDRPVPHRFEPNPVERVERIPGQSAQIDRSVITPLNQNYQEERRQREEQRRLLEAGEHQHHYLQQYSRTGPNDDYPSLDVHPSYYDPDEVFEIEDGEQYVSITQDPFILRRFLRTRRPTFEMPDRDSYNELWNLVEMLGEVRQQGLDQTHIEMLPVHRFSEGNSGESKDCNICLSAYSDGDEIRTLTCLHMFHTACIDEWLNRNAACPVCRRRIEIEDSSQ